MSGQTMTIREIAELCETDERTVRRWIDIAASGKTPGEPGKMPELSERLIQAQESKKPARFDLREVLAIINAGGKHTLANLLAENTKGSVQNASEKSSGFLDKLSGPAIREIKEMYADPKYAEAAKRFDFLIGYKMPMGQGMAALTGTPPRAPATPVALPAPIPLSREAGFQKIERLTKLITPAAAVPELFGITFDDFAAVLSILNWKPQPTYAASELRKIWTYFNELQPRRNPEAREGEQFRSSVDEASR
jgi:hypothetical protein